MHFSTKTFEHSFGLSACFRQWRAKSHCRYLHGYALQVQLTFGAKELDDNGWVIDFGSFGPIKAWLQNTFDHKLVAAHDDPQLDKLRELDHLGLCQLVVVNRVGCESFASLIADQVQEWLESTGNYSRVFLVTTEVREHGGNSGIFSGANTREQRDTNRIEG